MKIANKLTVGLVSIAFVTSSVIAFSATTFAQDPVADLQAQLAALTAQLAALEGAPTVTTTSTGGSSNAACPYTWARNLTIGSTGDDVRQLQRFLNGNPQTQVATSGTGSPGNETSYYGPATARAVSKFQEMYAAQILTPLGLTKGTGGFYTSTRNHANNLCRVATQRAPSPRPAPGTPRPPTYPETPRPTVPTGDTLAVAAGKHPGDSFAVLGAQRVPFTSIVLTAGGSNVRVEGIRVKQFGLSSSDNFDSVALVDVNGVQIGSSRSLNSRDEALLGGNFVIPKNRSVTLAVVGNIADTVKTASQSGLQSGAVAGLEVVEISADTNVGGQFPIRGAAHVMSDSITLQKVEVDIDRAEGEVELNTDTEVTSIKIGFGGAADEEDGYLRSITLEQDGTADEDEVGDVEILIDGDEVEHSIVVDGDRYVINFDSPGVMIEENEDIEVSLQINTGTGAGETVRFILDDPADIYVVGSKYGYGLPIDTDANGDLAADDAGTGEEYTTIQAGEISGGKVGDFEDEITYGKDRVLGALEVEFEGEDIHMEDLTFSVTLDAEPYTDANDNAWVEAEEDEVRLSGLHLRIDGERVASADEDVEFKKTEGTDGLITKSVDFSDRFEVDVRGTREVLFEIVADLDEDWSNFDSSTIEFILTDVDEAEGEVSEDDYTANGKYFYPDLKFESVTIKGNLVDFNISNNGVDEVSYVHGAEDVVFATLEVDTDDAIDDIEINDLYISFEATVGANLRDLRDCRILDEGGKEIGDASSLKGSHVRFESDDSTANTTPVYDDNVRFRFDSGGYTVEAGKEIDLDIVCDIDDDANEDDTYQVLVRTATDIPNKDDGSRVRYEVGRDDFTFDFEDGDSDEIKVSGSGTLSVTTDSPSDDFVFAVATGKSGGADNVEVLEIDLEAEDEDIVIKAIYLAEVKIKGVAATKESLGNLIDTARFRLNKMVTARPGDFKEVDLDTDNDAETADEKVLALEFDNISGTIKAGTEKTITIGLDLDSIGERDRDHAGLYLTAGKIYVEWEGKESDREQITEYDIPSSDFAKAVVFPNTISVNANANSNDNLKNGSNKKIYEFSVTNGGTGDAYLRQVGLDFSISAGVTLTKVTIHRGTSASNPEVTASQTITSGPNKKFEFTRAEEVEGKKTLRYSVYATIAGVGTDDSLVTELSIDSETASPVVGQEFATIKGGKNFVWSPNTYDKDGAKTDNADWFSGWGIFDDGDVDDWSLNK